VYHIAAQRERLSISGEKWTSVQLLSHLREHNVNEEVIGLFARQQITGSMIMVYHYFASLKLVKFQGNWHR
jgi:hypothetical protein